MAKSKKVDVFRMILEFQRDLLENRPEIEQMRHEVQMMRFKIRPLQGDISLLNLEDKNLIEMLWNLGKMDEFFRNQSPRLTRKERDILFQFLDNLYDQFQKKINKVDLRLIEGITPPSPVEMEIYKESKRRKRLN
ncbi:hypothetical protein HYT33_02450 [Candidatus Roizmanbacteria bacterium]|nr:hypothetical protein [Candidatus Roizmanbacteria bacterium]